MTCWTEAATLRSEDEYREYRDDNMCCASTYQTESLLYYSICVGEHPLQQRRLKCVSETCFGRGDSDCLAAWKV